MHRRIAHFSIIVSILLLTGCDVSLGYWRARATDLLSDQPQQAVPVPTLPPAATKMVTLAVPSTTPTPAPTATPTLPSEPFFENSKTVNGIEITVNNIRREKNELEADICFPVLDGEDWMLHKLSFLYGNTTTSDYEGLVIDPIIPAENGIPGRRCDTIYFSLPEYVDLSEFTITVHSIYAPPREGGTCARAEIVAQRLAEQGIKAACVQEENFEGYQVVEKPASMSEAEAGQLLMDAMWYVIKGPWEFNARLH